eukprot:3144482-Pyramimonas_sp.AAC.2
MWAVCRVAGCDAVAATSPPALTPLRPTRGTGLLFPLLGFQLSGVHSDDALRNVRVGFQELCHPRRTHAVVCVETTAPTTGDCHGGPIRRRERRSILTTDQSDAGSAGIFSQRINQTQGAQVYSHGGPIGRRQPGPPHQTVGKRSEHEDAAES